jgi:Ala-tRNA(Pro) deacylase
VRDERAVWEHGASVNRIRFGTHFAPYRKCRLKATLRLPSKKDDTMNVQEFLIDQQVAFDAIPHRDTYDAQRLAQVLHTPGQEVAKTVLLRADGGYAYIVAVLPATKMVDLRKVSNVFGGSRIELATELEIKQHCPDCEMGTLPPFGSQYAMKTVVDTSLTFDEEIVFEGNSHREAIRMQYGDYYELEHPMIAQFAVS